MFFYDPDYRLWIALAVDCELAFHLVRLAVMDIEQKSM